MIKRIMFCDICDREINDRHKNSNLFTYSLYKNVNGLWKEQDLCSLCYMRLVKALKEDKDE